MPPKPKLKKITPTKILELREEYYTTLTAPLEPFLQSHNLTIDQIPGCETWNKPNELIIPPTSNAPQMDTGLAEAKELILKKALDYLKGDKDIESIKEFKDVVAIIDTLDKQNKADTPADGGTNNVQVLVQNIVNNFRDDC